MRAAPSHVCLLFAAALIVAAASPSATSAAEIQHVHLIAPNPEQAAQWYVRHMVCSAWARKDSCRTNTSTQLNFVQGTPKGGSEGTGIDHLGFSFADLTAKMKELEGAGVKVVGALREAPGFYKIAFIEDPWGTKIELVEDSQYLGFHHVHLRSAEPDTALAWYLRMLGGERVTFRGRLNALRYGRVWLFASPVPKDAGAIVSTEGRSADHRGWSVADIDATAADLKAKGVERSEPRRYREPYTKQQLQFTMLAGPDDVRIEVLQVE